MGDVREQDVARVVQDVIALVAEHYVDPGAAPDISLVLSRSLSEGRYRGDERSLADAVTADLQSVNGDKHLRVIYHADTLPEQQPGDDAQEIAALTRWASQTCGGVARVECLAGNVGYLEIQPVLFPVAICGEAMSAAMSLVASAHALLIDQPPSLRGHPTIAPPL